MSARPLADNDFSRGRSVVIEAMSRYPDGLLQRELTVVYLVGDLEILPAGGLQLSRRSSAGTNSKTCLYLRVLPATYSVSGSELTETFHHEFSSILLRNHNADFPATEWLACNPPDFSSYSPATASRADVRESSTAVDFKLATQGFVNAYCQSSMENDFNMVAAHLFVRDADFVRALQGSPRLRAKANLAVGFYHKIDPAFGAESFGIPGLE